MKISLRDSLDENSLLKASFRYYYSTESIKALENIIKIFSEQLLISEGICLSFEESDKSGPKSDKETIKELSTIIEEIHQLIAEQEKKSKELYFPDAAEKVVKQFLSHYSSESFTYFSAEIKSFNEKVAKDLVEYLNNFYRGM
uniref:Uncharacterized protein n=1 Tax=Panagrolaimus superbus TaxID=310955 RepID=A0A914XQH3_9BILA